MQTLFSQVLALSDKAIRSAYGEELALEDLRADVALAGQEAFGHFQCNSALRIGKLLKQPPRSVAETIVAHLDRSLFAEVAIAGPGFINLTLDPRHLSQELQQQLLDPRHGVPLQKKERVIVEFSSPNVAKELHVGHLRSTIIGDCLARLFEFLGHDVLRLNHVGDWGTQFGMLIAYLKIHAPRVLKGEEAADLPMLMQWYKEAKIRFDQDPEFKKRSQQEVVHLQGGDSDSLSCWELICDISRRGYQEIYDLLDVKLVERGESFYNEMLPKVVEELESKGLVTISEGAKCVFIEGYKIPLMVQKSDGGYNYDTTDMAAIRQRILQERADRIICVTDLGQSLHFELVFRAARLAGWVGPELRLDHVGFGLVLGADGKKFKTRSGETEKLIDLLVGAIEKARSVMIERLPVAPASEIEHLAKTIGIGAVKYADLSSHRTKDYTFSYDRMLRFEGNTAVFILYSYVRINGIKRKTHADLKKRMEEGQIELKHPSEIALGFHLRRFGEVIGALEIDLLPHRLTEYLYTLAEKFNAFFRDCRVEGSKEETSRLLLAEATAHVMKKGLELLGLETVERM